MASTTEAPISDGYDAAHDNGQRSTLFFPHNSRQEYSTYTRRRMLEKNRALEANFPLITRIQSKFSRYVVGRGLKPRPATNHDEWNKLAEPLFIQWANNRFDYSVDASCNLWEDQRFVAKHLGAGDGETFNYLTHRDGRPCTQRLDPYEVESPWGGSTAAGSLNAALFEDGVRSDDLLRPFSYSVRELPGPRAPWSFTWREIAASAIVHVYRRRRAKQFRGLPPLYSGMNAGNDALDEWALAIASAKLHSLLAVSRRKSGAKGKTQGFANQLEKILDADGNTVGLEEKFRGGAVTVDLGQDEELVLHASQRPTIQELEAIKFACHFIAMAADLPFSVVFSFMGVGGTATRADLEDAQNTFGTMQDRIIVGHTQPIYVWRIAKAMESGELPRCQDPHWWKTVYSRPPRADVDYGRTAAATIALIKAGVLTAPGVIRERGNDPRDQITDQVEFIREAMEECERQGVPFQYFIESTPGAVNAGEPNPPPPKKKPAGDESDTDTEDDE